MLGLAKFLTIQERRRFESISTSWKFIPNTNPGLPATIAFGHLWYNSGIAVPSSAAPSGNPLCQVANLTLGLMPMAPRTSLLPPEWALSLPGPSV